MDGAEQSICLKYTFNREIFQIFLKFFINLCPQDLSRPGTSNNLRVCSSLAIIFALSIAKREKGRLSKSRPSASLVFSVTYLLTIKFNAAISLSSVND